MRPTILLTNDDGVQAEGLLMLIEAIKGLGDIVVVAPTVQQSGASHAITFDKPVRLKEVSHRPSLSIFECDGTPVDCVKIAIDKVLTSKPLICLSGINNGTNESINVLYSGTMSAAIEAGIEGIPAAGISLASNSEQVYDFNAAKKYARLIAMKMISHPIDQHLVLNVNIPALPIKEIKGIKICNQGEGKYSDKFYEREDPFRKKYYWLYGVLEKFNKSTEDDIYALSNGFVSIVPIHIDLTHHHHKTILKQQWKIHDKKR